MNSEAKSLEDEILDGFKDMAIPYPKMSENRIFQAVQFFKIFLAFL